MQGETVTLTIPAECRKMFDDALGFHPTGTVVPIAEDRDGAPKVLAAPRLALELMDGCLDGAGHEVRRVCNNVQEDLVSELEKATAVMIGFAREWEKLEA
jgi:hypothetical protein